MLRAMLVATPPALLPAVFFTASIQAGPAMPKVIFQDSDGRRIEVQAPVGHTAMEVAVDNGVSGILAECGGACACATCHGYIAEEWLAQLKPMEEMEDAMLDAATDRRANSRLLCQIELGPELDGLKITVADNGA